MDAAGTAAVVSCSFRMGPQDKQISTNQSIMCEMKDHRQARLLRLAGSPFQSFIIKELKEAKVSKTASSCKRSTT